MSIIRPSLRSAALSGGPTLPGQFAATHIMAGALKADGFAVSLRSPVQRASLDLQVATDPAFANVVATVAGSAMTANDGWAKWTVTGLSPNTTHYVRAKDGAVVSNKSMAVKTLASGPMSFSFAMGSCCDQGYDPITWDRIAARNPTWVHHMGDLQYLDIGDSSGSWTQPYLPHYQEATRSALGRPKIAQLLQKTPIIYHPDDHDSGCNTAAADQPIAVHDNYRATFPHYTLAATKGWYQSAVIGRVRLIILDRLSWAQPLTLPPNDPSKTVLGTTQSAWLESELLAAKAANQAVILDVGAGWVGGPDPGKDQWFNYTYARQLILDFIVANAVKNICIIHGDMHGIAVDSGAANASYAPGLATPIPVYCAAPFQAGNSSRGGPWDLGSFISSQRQYGMIEVTDTGGPTLTVTFKGYRSDDDALLVQHSMTRTL